MPCLYVANLHLFITFQVLHSLFSLAVLHNEQKVFSTHTTSIKLLNRTLHVMASYISLIRTDLRGPPMLCTRLPNKFLKV